MFDIKQLPNYIARNLFWCTMMNVSIWIVSHNYYTTDDSLLRVGFNKWYGKRLKSMQMKLEMCQKLIINKWGLLAFVGIAVQSRSGRVIKYWILCWEFAKDEIHFYLDLSE